MTLPSSRRFLFLGILAAPFLAAAPLAAGDQPPDILMIAIDDLRPMLSCYGDPRVETPNIDRIAKRGVLFERAYCQYAKCGTSRLSLMTGLRPESIGVFSNSEKDVARFRDRRPDARSLARHFKDSGYTTRGFGKIYHDGWDLESDWSLPPSPGREREMWEIHDEENPEGPTLIAERLACPVMQSPEVDDEHFFAGRMTRQVIEVMGQHDRKTPLFLAVGYRRPHLPFIAPKRYFEMHRPDESWLAPNPEPAQGSPLMAWFNSDGYGKSAENVGLKMPLPPNHEEAVAWNGYEMRSYLEVPYHGDISQTRQLELLQAYAACVSYVDAQIGKLLDALAASDRLADTIIVLWSDHGWHLGEQSAWGKMTNFEIATRVPLLIVGPGIEAARSGGLAELVDLYPTLCELAGIAPPGHLEGESLKPLLAHPHDEAGTRALSQYSRFGGKYMGYALRTPRYRYVEWRESASGSVVERELYDHESDPGETRNRTGEEALAETRAKLAEELRAALGQ